MKLNQNETITFNYSGPNMFPEINGVRLNVDCKPATRLEVLETYLSEARLNPEENREYIKDLEFSIKQERKFPTKNYTQECYGVIVQGKVKQDYMK